MLGVPLNLSIVIFHTSIKRRKSRKSENKRKVKMAVCCHAERFLCIAHGDVGSNKNVICSREACESFT
jgi:hypothetical protein